MKIKKTYQFNNNLAHSYVLKMAFISLSLVFFSGCSLFKPTHRADLTPYAENIIKITQDIKNGLAQYRAGDKTALDTLFIKENLLAKAGCIFLMRMN